MRIEAKCNGKVIASKKERRVNPGEMCNIQIPMSEVDSDIVIDVIKGGITVKKEIICIVCPIGCRILAEGTKEEITSIEGFTCGRGKEYGTQEFLHPVRILTSTVKVDGEDRLVPVRSDRPHSKGTADGLHGRDTEKQWLRPR